VEVLAWNGKHSHEGGCIPCLGAHLEEERRKASRGHTIFHDGFHGGGGAHYLKGALVRG
jgi:hypothetical protein